MFSSENKLQYCIYRKAIAAIVLGRLIWSYVLWTINMNFRKNVSP
jgi:hypothetical protein